jgi:hypothetical protein
LAQHVEDRSIPVGEGVPGWYVPLGTQVGAFPRFTERRRFERKKAKNTLQAASPFLLLGSWQEVRRVYGVHIKPIIERWELRVRLRPIGAYTPVGIIDMGLGAEGFS